MIDSDRRNNSWALPSTLAWLRLAGFIGLIAVAYLSGSAAWAQSNPVPLINQPLVPDATAPGGQQFTLTVNGTGFVSGSVVQWDGSALATTFVSGSQLTATVPATDVASAGTATVRVVNPGTPTASNLVSFEVAAPQSAAPLNQFSSPASPNPSCIASADLNGDGLKDLVACDLNDAEVWVYLGNGDGTFRPGVAYPVAQYPGQVLLADFNGDGKLDLAVACEGGPWILLGNGDGTFRAGQNTGDGFYTYMATGDFNGDGLLDLAVTVIGSGQGQVAFLPGYGDGTFGPPAYSTTAQYPEGLAVGDFNGDGKLDLAVGAADSNNVGVLLGNGDGTFQPPLEYPIPADDQAYNVVTADLNGDGRLDLVVGTIGQSFSVLLGNGDGTFQTHVDYATPKSYSYFLDLADLNGDDKLDVAMAGDAGSVYTALGNGDGTFQTPAYAGLASGVTAAGIVLADLFSSGQPQVVAQQGDGSALLILVQVPSAISPTVVKFGHVKVGTSSSPSPVTVSNIGQQAFSVTKLGVTGRSSSVFSESNNCKGQSVPPGGHCTINVVFSPRTRGLGGATLILTDTADYSPQFVLLSGVGVP